MQLTSTAKQRGDWHPDIVVVQGTSEEPEQANFLDRTVPGKLRALAEQISRQKVQTFAANWGGLCRVGSFLSERLQELGVQANGTELAIARALGVDIDTMHRLLVDNGSGGYLTTDICDRLHAAADQVDGGRRRRFRRPFSTTRIAHVS